MKHAKDFNGIRANSIGKDVGSVANDRLAGPATRPGRPIAGFFSEQVYGSEDFLYGAVCRGGVVFRDIVRFRFEVG